MGERMAVLLVAGGCPTLARLGDCLAHRPHVAASERGLGFPRRRGAGAELVEPAASRGLADLATRPRRQLAVRRDDREQVVEGAALEHAVADAAGELARLEQRILGLRA